MKLMPENLALSIARLLLGSAVTAPYFHLPGYMLRYWLLGDRSPERNADNAQWHGRTGGALYRWVARRMAVRLHVILRSDRDRALHDHPFASVSLVLAGGYWEIGEPTPHCRLYPTLYAMALEGLHRRPTTPRAALPLEPYGIRWRGPGCVVLRSASAAHRLVLPGSDGERRTSDPAVTVFVMGRKRQGRGFYPGGLAEPITPDRKVPWRTYLAQRSSADN